MKQPLPAVVTDHAVLRWLEREMDLPVEEIRAAIAKGCALGAALKARSVIWGRSKFIIKDGHVVTVTVKAKRGRKAHG